MPWNCHNCNKPTKGFANGKTLCWVCQQAVNRNKRDRDE